MRALFIEVLQLMRKNEIVKKTYFSQLNKEKTCLVIKFTHNKAANICIT